MIEWLKEILGDSYTEEIDKKVSENIGKNFVSKGDFNTLNETKKTLDTQLKDANKQIEEFKNLDVDGIKKAADEWKEKAEKAQKDSEAQIAAMKFDHALEGKLSGLKAKDTGILMGLLKKDDLKLTEDGSILGLDDQIKKIKEEKDFLFEPDEVTPQIVKGGGNSGTGGAGDDALRAAMGLPIGDKK